MRRPTPALLAAAGLSLASLAGALATAQDESDGHAPGTTEARSFAPPLDLVALRDNPGAHLGERFEVAFQLSSVGEPWQPWFSRFGPSHFERVEAWCDTQLPWIAEDYADPAPFLFVPRESAQHFLLRHARPHERFIATIEVREQFLGEPWCEIVEARRLTPSINEGAVLHAERAIEQFERGSRELALSELDRALASPLPEHARAALEGLRARWIARD